MSFRDQVVWITGASGGIGEAIALELSARGTLLILSARREDRLDQVRAACADPDKVAVLPMDVTDFDGLPGKVAEAIGLHGRVDVLLNNAGVGMWAKAEETTLETDRRIMDVDFFGPVALTKAILPHMLARGSGRIGVVSSVAAKLPMKRLSTYCAAKHALHGFFDTLRLELKGRGIGVTLMGPGFVKTDLVKNSLRGDGSVVGKDGSMGLPVGAAAAACVRALARGVDEVFIGRERFAVLGRRFAPGLVNRILAK
ncbi:MAG: SDR family oxidoreductase [Pseudomonadota bacterium]